jgi:putative ABC transport system permease protein
MLKNYLTIALRNLLRYKLSTAINILGLSIGTTFCIPILLFLRNELTFDAYYRNSDTMFNLVTKVTKPDGDVQYFTHQPVPVHDELKKTFSEIKGLTLGKWGDAILTSGDQTFNEHVLFTTADVIPMFDIALAYGTAESVFKNADEIIISEAMAKKYFGDKNPLGESFIQLFFYQVYSP